MGLETHKQWIGSMLVGRKIQPHLQENRKEVCGQLLPAVKQFATT